MEPPPKPPLRLAAPDEVVPDSAWPWFVEEWVLPYLYEPALFPVLLALLGHVVVVLAPLMLIVARVHHVGAALALLLAAAASSFPLRWEWNADGRPGKVAATVLLTWAFSAGAAVVGGRLGVL